MTKINIVKIIEDIKVRTSTAPQDTGQRVLGHPLYHSARLVLAATERRDDRMSKKDYKIRSSEFCFADIMPICDICSQSVDGKEVCDRCGVELGASFYCGDIVERDKAHPEHICTKCGTEVFTGEEDEED